MNSNDCPIIDIDEFDDIENMAQNVIDETIIALGGRSFHDATEPSGYCGDITGDGVTQEFIIEHNLNTNKIKTLLTDTNGEQLLSGVCFLSNNTLKFTFRLPPKTGTIYHYVIWS